MVLLDKKEMATMYGNGSILQYNSIFKISNSIQKIESRSK